MFPIPPLNVAIFALTFVTFILNRITFVHGYYTYTSFPSTAANCTLTGTLVWTTNSPNPYPAYGSPISPLTVCFILHSSGSVRLRVTDPSNPRWEINDYDPTFIPNAYIPCTTTNATDIGFIGNNNCPPVQITITETPNPFQYTITSLETAQIIVQSLPSSFLYYDQYINVGYSLPSRSIIYGLGERISGTLRLRAMNYTVFTLDQGTPGSFAWPELNYYGAHPMYVSIQPNDTLPFNDTRIQSYGSYFHNPHAMQIAVQYDNSTFLPSSPLNITYTTIGGIIDIFYFLSYPVSLSTVLPVQQILQQYQYVLGPPSLVPYYALGFHQCRYGYQTINETIEAHDLLYNASIPFETIWNDIDHMNHTRDFTLDPVRFPKDEVDTFVDELHKEGHRYILILDPAINIANDYLPWERGLAMNAYVLNSNGTAPFLGILWAAGVSVWPDFTSTNGTSWWSEEISIFHGTTGPLFDGLWVDTNEPQNVCGTGADQPSLCYNISNGEGSEFYIWKSLLEQGSIDTETWNYIANYRYQVQNQVRESLHPYSSSFNPENPPWAPITYHGTFCNPSEATINASAIQAKGLHYSLHSLYGYSETKTTYAALLNLFPTDRPFVLSRSTFSAASARYALHWTGDNIAEFSAMQQSLPEVMTLTLEGMPFTGADTGGFIGNATEELIIRWMQLASFGYGFFRAHHIPTGNDNNPAGKAWSKNASAIMNHAIRTRYAILPYMYTVSYRVAQGCVLNPSNQYNNVSYGCDTEYGGGLIRPLLYEYPNDFNTYNLTAQNMIGSGLLASPATNENQSTVTAYFPVTDTWYDFFTGVPAITNTSGYAVLDTPLTKFNLHVRGGHTIPLQYPNLTDMNVYQSRQQPVSLLVALRNTNVNTDRNNNLSFLSFGQLYWDDGLTRNPSVTDQTLFTFTTVTNTSPAASLNMYGTVDTDTIGPSAAKLLLQNITFFGINTVTFPTILTIKYNDNVCQGNDYIYNNSIGMFTINLWTTCNTNNPLVLAQNWTLTIM